MSKKKQPFVNCYEKMPHMKSALVILDMLNTFEFPEGKQLEAHARKSSKAIARLKKKLKAKNVPIIYVNDNFGHWLSNWEKIYEQCIGDDCLGKEIALTLRPDPDDYFILKPKHSAFHSTSFETLLNELRVKKLILTGIAGNICVLFTAHDAHMREYEITIPKDCIASNTKSDNEYALRQFKAVFKFNTPLSKSVTV